MPALFALPNEDYRIDATRVEAPLRCLIRTESEWARLREYGRIDGVRFTSTDFEEFAFIFVSMGMRSMTGYSIRIDSVIDSPQGVTAVVTQTHSEFGGDQVTYPVDMVRIPRPSRPVRFVEQ